MASSPMAGSTRRRGTSRSKAACARGSTTATYECQGQAQCTTYDLCGAEPMLPALGLAASSRELRGPGGAIQAQTSGARGAPLPPRGGHGARLAGRCVRTLPAVEALL
ncbi:unnamed protein product [Prorocentrum cordatum]|uniref:Subtilisin n=1 Tax=Prorocentrum cordatum TaxID=2364126 RepID=A0ABN9VRP8_9DINO|nr:unnamed protein product [Polarella glacialis]